MKKLLIILVLVLLVGCGGGGGGGSTSSSSSSSSSSSGGASGDHVTFTYSGSKFSFSNPTMTFAFVNQIIYYSQYDFYTLQVQDQDNPGDYWRISIAYSSPEPSKNVISLTHYLDGIAKEGETFYEPTFQISRAENFQGGKIEGTFSAKSGAEGDNSEIKDGNFSLTITSVNNQP